MHMTIFSLLSTPSSRSFSLPFAAVCTAAGTCYSSATSLCGHAVYQPPKAHRTAQDLRLEAHDSPRWLNRSIEPSGGSCLHRITGNSTRLSSLALSISAGRSSPSLRPKKGESRAKRHPHSPHAPHTLAPHPHLLTH